LKKTFKEGFKTKMKMVIISMPKMIRTKVAESTILVEEETHVKKKNVAKYHIEDECIVKIVIMKAISQKIMSY
jgi:hypothetical protein